MATTMTVVIRHPEDKPMEVYRVNMKNKQQPIDVLRFTSSQETFKIKTGTKMRRLFDAWLKTPTCVPPSAALTLQTEEWRALIQLRLNGEPIDMEDTAQTLGMHDKAVIDVVSLRSSPALQPDEGAALELADHIGLLLNNDAFHDVHFLVGAEEELIGANRTILAARSERFLAMLRPASDSQMEEARTGEVLVPNHTPTAFRAMLRYMYTGDVGDGSVAELIEVLSVAHFYVISALKARLEGDISQKVCKDNVATVLQAADLYDCDALKKVCRECVAEHFAELKGNLACTLCNSPELLVEIASYLAESPPKKRRIVDVDEM